MYQSETNPPLKFSGIFQAASLLGAGPSSFLEMRCKRLLIPEAEEFFRGSLRADRAGDVAGSVECTDGFQVCPRGEVGGGLQMVDECG